MLFYKAPQQCLYFLPDPQKQGSFLLIFFPTNFGSIFFGSIFSDFLLVESTTFRFIKIVKKLTLIFYKLIFNNFNSKVILENSDDQIFLINEHVISKSNSFVLPGSCVELKNYDVKQEPSDLKVVMASRLLWNKGVGDFIEAIKILKWE